MSNIHPNTLLFFEKLKNIVIECQKIGNVTIKRFSASRIDDEEFFLNPYFIEKDEEFNRNFNYYRNRSYTNNLEINFFSRYHVIAENSLEPQDISEQFVNDVMEAFINPNVGFQLVLQYLARQDFQWTDAFFESNLPEDDKIKLFRILGPSGRFHEMIMNYPDHSEYYPLILNCLTYHGSDNAELFYNQVILYFLDNGYIEKNKREECINMAIQYSEIYLKRFRCDSCYKQLTLFNHVREVTTPDEWLVFKDVFPLVTINIPENNKKDFFIDTPTCIEKIRVDVSAISNKYIEFIVENDVHKVIYKIENYINSNTDNLFKVKRMSRIEEFIYLEADEPINKKLFTNVMQNLFAELAKLSFEDFNTLMKNDKKEEVENASLIKSYVSKLILEVKLPVNVDCKKHINKI